MQLSKKYHPDLRPNDEAAKQKYLAISSAYDILGNESKRSVSLPPSSNQPFATSFDRISSTHLGNSTT